MEQPTFSNTSNEGKKRRDQSSVVVIEAEIRVISDIARPEALPIECHNQTKAKTVHGKGGPLAISIPE